jgi:ParB family transcriptional regulator, chromosome partitioning protein
MSAVALAPAVSGPARTTYPLDALIPSPANVRKKKRTSDDIMSMALSIAAHGGLLQNLVVVPEVRDGQRTGRAAVTAGETRRLALCLLRDGKVPDVEGFGSDYSVPVLEVGADEATAVSATENIQRTQMHPADQFEAFRDLHEQCGSIEHVAAIFNVRPLVVQQRLKLATASPRMFEVFRQDGMTLEQLMALCITDDHVAQERVWDAGKGRDWERTPQRLRQLLTADEVQASAPLARFVGLQAYEKAGGVTRRDLFGEDDHVYLCDAALLLKLAEQKLEKHAAVVRAEGWAWVEVRAQVTYSSDLNFHRAAKGQRELTDAERANLQAIEAEHDQAEQERDALYDKDETTPEEDARIRELGQVMQRTGAALDKLRDSLSIWTSEVLAHAGAVVSFDHGGKVVISRGLVRPQDRKAAAKAVAMVAPKTEGKAHGDTESGESKSGGLSESLVRRLTAHRTVALQRVMADNTRVALAALAHNLVQRVFDDVGGYRTITALDIQAKGCESKLDAMTESSIKASRAWVELQDMRHQWGERIPGDVIKLMPWLIALPMSELCDLIALCVSLTLDAVQTGPLNHPSDVLAEAVGLDMADWWEPTADEYLSRVPKSIIGQALSDASMSADAAVIEKLKKGEAVAKAEALLAGKRWLPAPLRPRG